MATNAVGDSDSAPAPEPVTLRAEAELTITSLNTVNEQDRIATFTATLGTTITGGFSVDVSTDDATGTGIATAGQDYTAIGGQTLSFAGTPNEMLTFSVTILDDDVVEGDETLTVSLGNPRVPTGAVEVELPSAVSRTVTIVDDDTAALSIMDVKVDESVGTATVTVRLDNAVQDGFSVDVSTVNATGTGIATASPRLHPHQRPDLDLCRYPR